MDELDLGATVRAFGQGQKVFNRYTLQRVLGRGALGAVWLAQDEELNRATALKFLPELVTLDRAAISELKSEVRRVIELAHPHIAKVHDLITDGRAAAISMEFVDGTTLAARREAASGGVLTPAELLPWLHQLGEALDYAHRDAHVIHRDVRPANIMVDVRGRAKLLDFGVGASLMESASRVSRLEVGGPPSYMSPQQLLGEDPMPADDIYSLGATLHEMLTGSPPFHSGNIVNHIQKSAPPPVNEIRRAAGLEPVPEVWEQLVARCLAKEAAARAGPIAELIKQLESGRITAPVTPTTPIAPATVVAAAPAAAPAVSAPPVIAWWKIPAYRWTAVAAVVLAGGLIYWFGDVPGRTEAAQAHELGVKAKVAGNWAQALPALKSAAARRRGEFIYQRDFNEAQEEWLKLLFAQQQALAPADAYAALQGGPAQLAPLLEGSTAVNFQKHSEEVRARLTEQLREKIAAAGQLAAAGKFAEAGTVFEGLKAYAALLPELPQARQAAQEAEVRHELAEAGAAAGRGEFGPALARIDAAARRGLLAADIEAARAGVREAARLRLVGELAAALLAGDRAASQSAVEGLATYTQAKFSVTAEQLFGQKELGDFLHALEELGIRPAAGAPRTSHLDLVLVDRLRGRFADQAAAARFLGSAYAEWTKELLAAQRPGFALYTAALARAEGFPLDAAFDQQARAQLAADLGFSVTLKPTVVTGDNAAGIRDAARSRLAALLQQSAGGWLKLADETPANSDMALALATQLRGLEQNDNRREATKVVRYQSGTTEESNPNHEQLASQLEDAENNYERVAESNRSTQSSANQLAGSGNLSALGAVFTGVASGLSQNEVNKARNRVNELRAQLARTPETVTRAQYANESYREITHDVTYGAALALTVEQAGRTLATGKGWASAYRHQTVEVVGNAQRNVPVAAPSYPTIAAVAEWLARDLSGKISAASADLLQPVQQATITLLQRQNATRRLPAAEADARTWGLIQLWTAGGLAPDNTAEMQNRVRVHLGLPAL